MNHTKRLFGLFGLVFALGVSIAAAQSLGDVARQQRDKKAKESKKAAKVFTNENMPARPPGEGPTAAGSMSSDASQGSSPAKPSTEAAKKEPMAPEAGSKPSSSAPDKTAADDRGKDYWQERFKSARRDLAYAKDQQQLSEDELSLLQVQQARELEPNVVNELGDKIRAKMADVEKKRTATKKAQDDLDKIQKEFDDSGSPAEWSKTEE